MRERHVRFCISASSEVEGWTLCLASATCELDLCATACHGPCLSHDAKIKRCREHLLGNFTRSPMVAALCILTAAASWLTPPIIPRARPAVMSQTLTEKIMSSLPDEQQSGGAGGATTYEALLRLDRTGPSCVRASCRRPAISSSRSQMRHPNRPNSISSFAAATLASCSRQRWS